MNKGFSLDNFKKKQSKTDASDSEKLPYWIDDSKPTIVAMYNGVISEYQKAKDLIDSGEELTPKQRQITNVNVCSHAEVVKSYLRSDRPDTKRILEFIKEKNTLLKEFWGKKNSIKRKSGHKLLRSELEAQNKILKSEIADLDKGLDKEYFKQWVDLFLVNNSKRLVKKAQDLQSKVDRLHEENITLKVEVKKLRRQTLKTEK